MFHKLSYLTSGLRDGSNVTSRLQRNERYPRWLLTFSIIFSLILLIAITYSVPSRVDVNKVKLNSKLLNISKLVDLQTRLWRPTKDIENFDSDFDEFVDDRILLQRNWIENLSKSKLFSDLKPKKILVLDGYDSYYGFNGELKCPPSTGNSWESKCILVQDDWWTGLFRNLEEFDGVIGIRNWVYRLHEGKLPHGVRQILFTSESPFVTRLADVSVNNAFLASYWRGSDITVPYGKWAPFQNGTKLETPSRNYAEGKTKLAAIVVSDCGPQNDRLGFVKELQRHMPVDVYGKCGTLRCEEPCFETLKKQYKFYLAFENANCRDYITEKFFRNALQYDMVPVVLGAHKKDYLYAAPPNSFIHVEDFQSPMELANYLQLLDQNDDLYNKFFEWKTVGELIDGSMDFFCRSCALLFMTDFVEPPVWPTGSTWKQFDTCLPPGRWYWNRHHS